ncbi:MAG: hypothetical protein HKN09_04920 [Saprospiraceae bacterium]|nr:hypothetical protein [Saprospiraceae bacterium]
MKIILSAILAVLCMYSCKTTDPVGIQLISPDPIKDQILTVVIEFEKTTNPEVDSLSIFNSIIAPGHVKEDPMQWDEDMDYICVFQGKDETILSEQSFQDPLRKPVEYVNDNGELAVELIEFDKQALPFRINYTEEVTKLIIYKLKNDIRYEVASFKFKS